MAATDPPPPREAAADDALALAPRLRDLRLAAGLTLEAAARRAGLSPAHLSRLESGLRQPSLPVLLGLAALTVASWARRRASSQTLPEFLDPNI